MTSSGEIVCVVEHGASRKKIVVNGKRTLDDIKDGLLKSAFKDLVNDQLIVQAFDPAVNDFIDFEESDVLESARLRLVQSSPIVPCTDGNKTHVSLDGSDQRCGRQQDFESSCISVEQSELPVAVNVCPTAYRFPAVPHHIRAELANMREGFLQSRQKSDVINWLCYDLTKYTLYPGKLYAVCAQELVSKYPKLRDDTKTGYGTWVMSLRFKAKNTRRRLPPGTPANDEARNKVKKPCTPSVPPSARNGATWMQEIETGEGEDGATIAAHLAIICKEMKKPVPDMEKVTLSMERTLITRKRWLYQEKPFVAEILEKYTALRSEDQISQEFFRHTGLHADAGISAFVNQYGERVLTLASQKATGKHPVTDFWKILDSQKEETKKYVLAVGVLFFLPLLVREKAGILFTKMDNEEEHMHPVVVYSGTDVFTSECVHVHVESLRIDVLDITSAVSTLMGVCWAFNIRYAPQAVKTLSLLEAFIGVKAANTGILCSQAIAALKS